MKLSVRIRKWIDRLFVEEQWTIGLVRKELLFSKTGQTSLSDDEIKWIRLPKSYFLADPVWFDEASNRILCEYVHVRKRKGEIALIQFDEDSIKNIEILKSGRSHLSYPQLYRGKGKCYVVPESALENNQIVLEVDCKTGKLIEEKVLIQDHQYVDPTIFFFNNIYWMFANPLLEFNSRVAIFYAPEILGPWRISKNNSLEIKNGRGAGKVFQNNGILYWPCQYNTYSYGGGIIIRKINELTTDTFSFENVLTLLPDPKSKYCSGMHTIEIGKTTCLIDGRRTFFSLLKPLNVLLSRLRAI